MSYIVCMEKNEGGMFIRDFSIETQKKLPSSMVESMGLEIRQIS